MIKKYDDDDDDHDHENSLRYLRFSQIWKKVAVYVFFKLHDKIS